MRVFMVALTFALALPASAETCSPIYTAQRGGKTFQLTFTEPWRVVMTGSSDEVEFHRTIQNGTFRTYLTEHRSDGRDGLSTEIIYLDNNSEIYRGRGDPPVLLLPDLSYAWFKDERFARSGYLPAGTWRLTGCVSP